jgi:Zn-dependent protease
VKLLLLLLTTLKWGKLATTGGTMLLSIGLYAWIWGWPYAVGFVVLIFVHEMGHYIAARQCGVNVSLPVIIPFIAWVKHDPVDVRTNTYIAFAGPLVGTVGAVAFYLCGRYTGNNLLIAISYAGLFINLFNLIPLPMLDGGQITAILSPRVWLFGVPVMLALMLYRPSPILFMVAILAIPQLIAAWNYDPNAPENKAYSAVPLEAKLQYGALYLALTAYLGVMTYEVHEMLSGIARPFSG